MSTHQNHPQDTPPQTATEHDPSGSPKPDTQSDPALDDGTSADWSSEGGAVPEGPATDPDDA
jgi:hypothetical protein